jgi:hypothetical protein
VRTISEPKPEELGRGPFNYFTEEGSNERIFSGTVWTSDSRVLGLMMMLLAGCEVELRVTGQVFKYQQASVRSFGWVVSDHPGLEDM